MAENSSPERGGSAPPADPDLEGRSESLEKSFGAGPETVTGIHTVTTHDDRAAKWWLASGVFWLIVVTTFAMIMATELAAPETFGGISWLVFSRVRPAHVEGVIYAWLTTMYFGAIFYFAPRLLGTKAMWNETLAIGTVIVYDLAMAFGFGLLSDRSHAGPGVRRVPVDHRPVRYPRVSEQHREHRGHGGRETRAASLRLDVVGHRRAHLDISIDLYRERLLAPGGHHLQ